ncbi:MAG TPA: GDP-L-fucose synthase [Chthoniobacterales bacterium]|jgi:GDP-L-fucose synthase|nr:GDP-L-fucose synthase [Chthoniobacterales bacterium]
MDREETIFIAGHRGLVGSAILRRLKAEAFTRLLTRSRSELDLTNRRAVDEFFTREKPAIVMVAAAKVGGIKANNDQPVEFLLENLQIQNNLIRAAHESGVRKLLFLGSSCIYPKHAPQPIPESAFLGGPLEPTNEAYAIAKIAGITLCQSYAREYGANFISAMPTNLYGPNDNFDFETSHVLAALLRKAHEAKEAGAKEIVVWGSGEPRREFMHVDDLADACLFLLQNYDSPEIINLGTGQDLTIRELAELVCEIVGFKGELTWDASKPDGTARKLLDISKIKSLGWEPKIPLREGIAQTYAWFRYRGAQKG